MAESELPNPTPQSEEPEPNPTADALPPDPLLESGSFIDPERTDLSPEPQQQTENVAFTPGSVIEAQPISMVAPGESTPRKAPRMRSDAEEMAKRPSWLPEDWRMETKLRTSGATAGLIDRYYFEPSGGRRFRSKNEVFSFLETGNKSKGKSNSKKNAGTPATPASQKKNKRKSYSKTDAGPSGSPVSEKPKKSSVKRKKSEAQTPQPQENVEPQDNVEPPENVEPY